MFELNFQLPISRTGVVPLHALYMATVDLERLRIEVILGFSSTRRRYRVGNKKGRVSLSVAGFTSQGE